MKTARAAARAQPSAKARGEGARASLRPRTRNARVALDVQYATRSRPLPAEDDFRMWVDAAMRAAGTLTIRVVGLEEGRTLNRAFRGRDYATNVLTFVLEDGPVYSGDLALCAPVVTREAREQGKTVLAHYAHLTVHGVLHLQGHDHDDDADAAAMETLETRILKRLGYPDPYAPEERHGRHTQ